MNLGALEYFGIALTLLVYVAASWLRRRTRLAVLNPLLVTIVVVIIVLVLTGVSFDDYNASAEWLTHLLTPVTVCLAVPLYEKLQLLRRNFLAIIVGVTTGILSGLLLTFGVAKLVSLGTTDYLSLLPRSVTAAIGMGISERIGGSAALTLAVISLTGVFGNLIGARFVRLIRIKDPVAQGLAIGTASHVGGTAGAFELGEAQGAMSSLAIVVAGIVAVVLTPLFTTLV
ncbi:MAG: LrgB family protein [Propionibacteriaceae bacterium]|jgi:predicted murein hydrolase (TIGR00659 family)|nr:LrgB family protein [Propionibacteriaceae bacterium]